MPYSPSGLLECFHKVPASRWADLSIEVSPGCSHYVLPLIRGSILRGHFELSAGYHSSIYVQTAPLLSYSAVRAKLAAALLIEFQKERTLPGITAVVALAHGATLLGAELSRNLNARILYAESWGEEVRLRRGQELQPGNRVLLVDNVVATGESLEKLEREILGRFACIIMGHVALIDRRRERGGNLVSLACLEAPLYSPEGCPLCAKGIVLTTNEAVKGLSP